MLHALMTVVLVLVGCGGDGEQVGLVQCTGDGGVDEVGGGTVGDTGVGVDTVGSDTVGNAIMSTTGGDDKF